MKHAKILALILAVSLAFAAGCSSDKTTGTVVPPDDAPPLPPTGLFSSPAVDGTYQVGWTPNAEPDLAGYRVYLYDPSLSHTANYQLMNEVLLVGATAQVVVPIDGEVYVCVSAVDQGGNESANSGALHLEWQSTPANPDTGKPPLQGEPTPGGDTTRGGTPPSTDPPPTGGGDGTTPGDDPNQH